MRRFCAPRSKHRTLPGSGKCQNMSALAAAGPSGALAPSRPRALAKAGTSILGALSVLTYDDLDVRRPGTEIPGRRTMPFLTVSEKRKRLRSPARRGLRYTLNGRALRAESAEFRRVRRTFTHSGGAADLRSLRPEFRCCGCDRLSHFGACKAMGELRRGAAR